MIWRGGLTTLAAISAIGLAARAVASPAEIFTPYLDRIQRELPAPLVMRLPTEVRLGGPADDEFIQQLTVRVFSSASPPGVTVGLFSCGDGSQFCLIGTFSVASASSPTAQADFRRHVAAANPIQLTKGVRGYLLDGSTKQPPSLFSSVMWSQDGVFHSLSFAEPERQNILYMAVSMANNEPIRSQRPSSVISRWQRSVQRIPHSGDFSTSL